MKLFLTLLTTGLIGMGVANATPQNHVPTAPESVEITDTELREFASIYVDVESTRNELSAKLSQVESQEEAQKVQLEMRDAIIAKIEDHGWTLEKYNQVAQAISNDDQLREKALEYIQAES